MRNLLKNISFQYRILLSCLMVAILPLFFCTIIMVQLFSYLMNNQLHESGSQTLEHILSSFSSAIVEYSNTLTHLSNNSYIQSALVDRSSDLITSEMLLTLYQAQDNVHSTNGFSIYDSGALLRFAIKPEHLPQYLPIPIPSLTTVDLPPYGVFLSVDQNLHNLYLLKTIYSPHHIRLGYVATILSTEDFNRILSSYINHDTSIQILNNKWETIYTSTSSFTITESLLTELSSLSHGFFLQEQGYNYYIHYDTKHHLTFVLQQDITFLQGLLHTLQMVSILFATISLIVCIITAILISHSLMRPIAYINEAMIRIMDGNLNTRIQVYHYDELGKLSTTFNQMAEELQEHIDSKINHEKEVNRLQMQQLHEQLNPHFLYNTLDSIKWIAKINQVPTISKIATSLSSILRSSIMSEQFITIEEELDLLVKYIDIQNIRFHDKFTYNITLPTSLYTLMIPKLILQPLVENAILHGLNDMEHGTITITGYTQYDLLYLLISDTGCGIPPDKLYELQRYIEEGFKGHVGLYNVNHIIKLHYGTEYGLTLQKPLMGGTTIQIRIPLNKESIHD
ncbi:MAG: histidine kinase [Eubacteriales bacterium]